jgi:F-type H+-transporting ATPase subunit gamma
MASLRDIRTRINSVRNTQQVTRAMKMVAAAKLRRAQERIFQARPYAYRLSKIISLLKEQLDPTSHELFHEREHVGSVLYVVVTADRGLAGAFNSNIIREAELAIAEHEDLRASGNLYILAVGRKGSEHFTKRGYQMVGSFRGVFDNLEFTTAREVVDLIVEGYLDGRWDEVKVAYNEFKNTISQNRVVEPFLPIPREQFLTPVMAEETNGRVEKESSFQVDFIFEPGAAEILNVLIPRFLRYQLWRVLLESNASEQGARMVAMDSATSNAEDLLRDLRLKYNRARQSAITTEIIEIVSGANALEEAS